MSDGKVTIDIELDSAKAASQADSEGRKAGDKFASGFGSKMAGVAKVAGAAMAAAGAAVVKEALELYSQYEQLAGGVETLFGDAADAVKANADAAFKTAGLSANQYMETVTSFSASLIQSLGKDTAKAADYADMAIRDMADNANKMGTSIDLIQQSYSSFARGNYAMLDNLKLGYGGTKAEMERLLADAEALKAANGEMVDYSITSFADMVEAIHVVQESMGITGATAAEAATTIEGSVNSMKAAWDNWLTGLGNSEADMAALTQSLVDSVVTVASNVLPAIATIMQTLITTVVDSIGTLASSASSTLSANGPAIMAAALEAFTGILSALLSMTPQILSALLLLLASLVVAIAQKGGEFFSSAVQVMTEMARGIASGAQHVVSEVGRGIDDSLARVRSTVGSWVQAGKDLIGGLVSGVVSAASSLAQAAINAVSSAVSAAKSALGIASPSKVMRDEVGKPMAQGIAVGFERYNPLSQIEKTLSIGASRLSATVAGYGSVTNNNTHNITFAGPVTSAVEAARDYRLATIYGMAGA